MKAVLISIRPKWCELIASGKKTIEVRKTSPKVDKPFKVYIYETKDKNYDGIGVNWENGREFIHNGGKVIGEFVCDKVENIFSLSRFWLGETIEESTCWSSEEIIEYSKESDKIYGWHISDLKIYDKPRELSEFHKPCIYGEDSDVSCFLCEKSGYSDDMYINCFNTVTRSPQSWCYVEEVC